MRLCHNSETPLRVGKIKRVRDLDVCNTQIGGGVSVPDDESLAESVQTDQTDDDTVSEASGTSTTPDATDTEAVDGEEEGEEEEEGGEKAVSDGENWVFRPFLDDVDEKEGLTLKQRQKMFRERYADHLVWNHHLKQNKIHKKVMKTVRDLEDGSSDYDKPEAFRAAVEQRKFLLNRLVEDPESDDGDTDPDNEVTQDLQFV